MAAEPTEEWRELSLVASDDEGSSSDESTPYKEEVVTPPPQKKHRTEEEEEDLTNTLVADPSTRNSRTPTWEQADDEDRVIKLLIKS